MYMTSERMYSGVYRSQFVVVNRARGRWGLETGGRDEGESV